MRENTRDQKQTLLQRKQTRASRSGECSGNGGAGGRRCLDAAEKALALGGTVKEAPATQGPEPESNPQCQKARLGAYSCAASGKGETGVCLDQGETLSQKTKVDVYTGTYIFIAHMHTHSHTHTHMSVHAHTSPGLHAKQCCCSYGLILCRLTGFSVTFPYMCISCFVHDIHVPCLPPSALPTPTSYSLVLASTK